MDYGFVSMFDKNAGICSINIERKYRTTPRRFLLLMDNPLNRKLLEDKDERYRMKLKERIKVYLER